MGLIEKEGDFITIRTDDRQIVSRQREKELSEIRNKEITFLEKEITEFIRELSELGKSVEGDTEYQIKRMEELSHIITEKEQKLKHLKTTPPTSKVRGLGLIFYSDGPYFDYFYAKHVTHKTGSGISTVIVIDGTEQPKEKVVRESLEISLYKMKVKTEYLEQNVPIEQVAKGHVLAVREWSFSANEFVSPPVYGFWCFREIFKVKNIAELDKFVQQNKISSQDIKRAENIIEKSKMKGDPYIVTYMAFIDKYFVLSRQRAFG